jgi:pilus assembly protein CpaD
MFVKSFVLARGRAALLLGVLAFAVAGCQNHRIVTGSIPHDYRDRHPIQINEGVHSVQLFIGSGRTGLTPEQRALAGAFAAQWRRHGSGAVTIELPVQVANEVSSAKTVRELRSLLAASGVPHRAILVRAYQTNDPSNVGATRLSFPAIKAQVASRCHLGQTDLGVTPDYRSAQNEPYWNFGCATQHNLAATVANPEDLVQPRAETPASAARRRTVMDKYRQGQDPSTVYTTTTNGSVSNVGR